MEIKKVESQSLQNDLYEKKVPYVVKDEFGNEATFYRKETFTKAQREETVASLQKQIDALQADLDGIAEIETEE